MPTFHAHQHGLGAGAKKLSPEALEAAIGAQLTDQLECLALARRSTVNDLLRKAVAAWLKAEGRRAQKRRAKRAVRKDKSAETHSIYSELAERAAGRCEGCGEPFSASDPAQLDHFWGRGKVPEAVANCWMLHRSCHRMKTDNLPGAASWLDAFARHAERHGYRVERGHALSRLDGLVAVRSGRDRA